MKNGPRKRIKILGNKVMLLLTVTVHCFLFLFIIFNF